MLIICYCFYFCNIYNNNLKYINDNNLIYIDLDISCFAIIYSHIETSTTLKSKIDNLNLHFFTFFKYQFCNIENNKKIKTRTTGSRKFYYLYLINSKKTVVKLF